jgi:sugar phosphate isomerase/epimerase
MDQRPKLGFDNYAIRALGWKAPRLLDYAAALQLDTVLFSDLGVFEELSDRYLAEVKAKADGLDLEIQVGTLSICPSSVIFNPTNGSAEEQVKRTIRVAQALGSSVVRCVLGEVRDRRSAGGIPARIAETVLVLKSVREYALDAGVKICVENHAGDMQAWELVTLIEEAGSEFVRATMDAGNAAWALEHPAENLEILGPYALSTGIRDSVLWEVEDGAVLQWTAMGEGSIDWPAYFNRFGRICPETPVQLETISGRPIVIPYWKDDFWEAYRNARIPEFMKFLGLAKRGRPLAPFDSFASTEAICEQQKSELERSVRFCRDVLGLGRKGRDRVA